MRTERTDKEPNMRNFLIAFVLALTVGAGLGLATRTTATAAVRGGGPPIIQPTWPMGGTCPGGARPVCVRCSSAGRCEWSCYGGYVCQEGGPLCVNGVDCISR